jgi:predicted alpha/beta superfamily hydrolase
MLLFGIALTGCGGGSSSGDGGRPMEGTVETRTISSRFNVTHYPLSIYLPPASAGLRSTLPVVYLLDGETWFEPLVDIAESLSIRVIIVGVNGVGQRNHDFVPLNSCSPNGGGQDAYFDFIRQDLLPYVEGTFGGDPSQRALFGHSHGGSFVLYAMFSESPGQHSFKAYLASDASLGCMLDESANWEQAYASAHSELPVRLHLSYATAGNYTTNLAYSSEIAQRNYGQFAFEARPYNGSHIGIGRPALIDGIAFAFPSGP